MGMFSSRNTPTIGILIDIGSASVLVAIVTSDPQAKSPEIIWSHREFVQLREVVSSEEGGNNILTVLMSAVMQLNSSGIGVLQKESPHAGMPSFIQITISAPWSYTVTKTISYSAEAPFTIDSLMIKELLTSAETSIALEMKENEAASDLGLAVISNETTEVLANGYAVSELNGQKATSVVISRTSSITEQYLLTALTELQSKTFPRAAQTARSFMTAYYKVIAAMYPEWQEYCLVDITFEATEIGVVREGVLRYCTHTPTGVYGLARELSRTTGVPLEESVGKILHQELTEAATDPGKATAAPVHSAYEQLVADLFRETGDTLSLPKTILLHSTLPNEDYFTQRITTAAQLVTSGNHRVVSISRDILKMFYPEKAHSQIHTRHDTSVLVSAQHFHLEHTVNESKLI